MTPDGTAQDGDRVKLIRCRDEYTRLSAGALGTVRFVDALGTVHVKWDNGSTLGLVPGVDEWECIGRTRGGRKVGRG